MNPLFKDIYQRQTGFYNPVAFREHCAYRMASQISKESRIQFRSPLMVSDFSLNANWLLMAHGGFNATIFDAAKEDDDDFRFIGSWALSEYNVPTNINCCIKNCINWSSNNCFFSYTGHHPSVFTIDTERLATLERFYLSGASYINQHKPNHEISSIAVASNLKSVSLIDLRSGQVSYMAECHTDSVSSVAWSPVQKNLLASASYKELNIWDIRMTRKPLNVILQVLPEIQFIPGTNTLVGITTDTQICILDVNGLPNNIHVYDIIEKPFYARNENRVKFSLVGFCNPPILFLPFNSEIKVINLKTMKIINEIVGHFFSVHVSVYNPLKNELYTASEHEKLVWTV